MNAMEKVTLFNLKLYKNLIDKEDRVNLKLF